MPPKTFDIEDAVAKLKKCPLFDKLGSGDLSSISMDEVKQVFGILDADGTGTLSVEDLQMLSQIPDLKIRNEDLQHIIKDCDKSGDGFVDIDEFYKALTQGTLSFNNLVAGIKGTAGGGKKDEVQRDKLLEFMKDEYDRNDALCSLPWALTLFVFFLLCTRYHMHPETAYSMRSALEGEISGEGGRTNHEGPFLERDVHDVPTFWDWMHSSLGSGCFKNDLTVFPYPGRIASYNQIVGGMLVTPTVHSWAPCNQATPLQEMFDSYHGPGNCHGADNGNEPRFSSNDVNDAASVSEPLFYHIKLEEIRAQIKGLQERNWIDQNVSSVNVRMLMYNGNLGMFTNMYLSFVFQRDGRVYMYYDSEGFLADPYENKAIIMCDVIFAILLFNMAWSESKEMFPALQNGLDGFLDYWEFWNAVDWMGVIGGTVCMGLWGSVCTMVGGDLQAAIMALPLKALDKKVIEEGFLTKTELDELVNYADFQSKLEHLYGVADSISGLYTTLRWCITLYSVVLMMKFFKAFKANPRLNIVTQTLLVGSTSIVHFFLVFFVIFLCFAVMATALFGHKIRTYSSFSHSMAMCWRILMGDFDYEEMEAVDWRSAFAWFVSYMVIVFLILFNMLLAIVMDTYSLVASSEPNPQTIWFQAVNTLKKTQKQRGHLSLWYLICEFEDDDFPAHNEPICTAKSLRKAFNKMSKHNAEYLISAANEWLAAQEGVLELSMADCIRLVAGVDSMCKKIMNTTHQTYEKIKEEASKPMQKRLDAIMNGEDPELMHGMHPGMGGGGGGAMLALQNGGTGGHPMGHGHGGPARSDPKVLHKLDQMQAQLDQQQVLIQRQQEYLEQRDAWIEQRIMFMERRSEKVELSATRLIQAMQKLDVDALSTIPENLDSLHQLVKMMLDSSNNNQTQNVGQQLQSLGSQIMRLQQYADEDTQARKVLHHLHVDYKQMKAAQAQGQIENVGQMRSVAAQLNALLYHAEEDADTKRMNCKSILKQFRAAQAGGREFPMFAQSLPPPPVNGVDGRTRVDSSATGSASSNNNQALAPSTLRQTGAAIADQNRSGDQGSHAASDASRPGSNQEDRREQQAIRDFPAPPPPGQASSSGSRTNGNGNYNPADAV